MDLDKLIDKCLDKDPYFAQNFNNYLTDEDFEVINSSDPPDPKLSKEVIKKLILSDREVMSDLFMVLSCLLFMDKNLYGQLVEFMDQADMDKIRDLMTI